MVYKLYYCVIYTDMKLRVDWTLLVPNDDAFDDLGNALDDLSNDDAKKNHPLSFR